MRKPFRIESPFRFWSVFVLVLRSQHCLRMSYSSKIDIFEKCHLAEDNAGLSHLNNRNSRLTRLLPSKAIDTAAVYIVKSH